MLFLVLAAAFFFAGTAPCLAQNTRPPARAQHSESPPAPAVSAQAPEGYSLSPERSAQAIAYARARHVLYFCNFAYGIMLLLLILHFHLGPRFRDWAERATGHRFLQAMVFVPSLFLTLDVLSLPGGVTRHWLSRRYGQSIQGWGSWVWDWTKGEMVAIGLAIFLVWLLYAVMRRSPRRWWFYAWLGAVPILVFLVFLSPLVVEPLFFSFKPLAPADPQLAQQLERVVRHAGQNIPESRMYIMNASSKLNELNAYVSGLGDSRRVVVWDTTIARMTTPEIVFVFGHEMGHYVLGHVRDGLIFASGVLLVFLFVGSRLFAWVVRRFGSAWRLRGVDDWASLPVLLLLVAVFSFLFTPVSNAYSRHLEHQADQYGLEVVHGIIPDSPEVAARAFQILGEVDLEEPAPSEFVKLWFFDHPPLGERIRFARTYDPWVKGKSPEFVK
jgi:Zn-dependent protease with chaperone function